MVQQNVTAIKTDLSLLALFQSCGNGDINEYTDLIWIFYCSYAVFFQPPDINSLTWSFNKNGLNVFQQVCEFTEKVKRSVALQFIPPRNQSLWNVEQTHRCKRFCSSMICDFSTYLSINKPPPERRPHSRSGQCSLATDTGLWRSRESK